MEKLIVKNFGAISNTEIDLKDLTIFIGKTGTGKSTLAKLLSILRNADFWMDAADSTIFLENLSYYQINNFLEDSTFIEYQAEVGTFRYDAGNVVRTFSEDILKNLAKFAQNKDKVVVDQIVEQSKTSSIVEEIVNLICNEVIYIPAERMIASFLSEKYAAIEKENLINLFPKYLLDFTATFNLASSEVSKLVIDLFGVSYQKKRGKDYVFLLDGKQFLLSETASGQQTTVPALIIFDHYAQDDRKKSYTFEEPELNLFPTAQKSLVELIAEKVLSNGHKMIITTHSPYILTAFNTLIQARNIYEKDPSQKDAISPIVAEKYWLDFSKVSVFYLDDSSTQSVMNLEYQTIDAHAIDDVSEIIATEYDQLLELKYEQDE